MDRAYGERVERKLRWHTQLVTPENPEYLYNYAESSADRDFDSPALIGGWRARSFVLKPFLLPGSARARGCDACCC